MADSSFGLPQQRTRLLGLGTFLPGSANLERVAPCSNCDQECK